MLLDDSGLQFYTQCILKSRTDVTKILKGVFIVKHLYNLQARSLSLSMTTVIKMYGLWNLDTKTYQYHAY